MALPTTIPQQSLPIATKAVDGNLYVEFDWYLFFYTLAQQVLGFGNKGTPASPFDILDNNDLNIEATDIPEAYRKIANLQLLEAQDVDISADIPALRRMLDNLGALDSSERDAPTIAPSLRDMANALLLALTPADQDAPPGSWQPYTPTVTAGTGTFTTVSAAGRWQRIGKRVDVAIEIDVTTVGTAASYIVVSLPAPSRGGLPLGYQYMGGRENAVTGKSINVIVGFSGAALALVTFYDGTFPGASGNKITITGSYEAA